MLQATLNQGTPLKDFGLLIRYHQASERGFDRARNELVKAQKERKKSEIGFESQTAVQPPAAEAPEPAPTSEIAPQTAEHDTPTTEEEVKLLSALLADLKARHKAA